MNFLWIIFWLLQMIFEKFVKYNLWINDNMKIDFLCVCLTLWCIMDCCCSLINCKKYSKLSYFIQLFPSFSITNGFMNFRCIRPPWNFGHNVWHIVCIKQRISLINIVATFVVQPFFCQVSPTKFSEVNGWKISVTNGRDKYTCLRRSVLLNMQKSAFGIVWLKFP